MNRACTARQTVYSRRQILAAGATIGVARALYGWSKAPPAKRPNIVAILADDQGWGDLSIHGNTNLATPNVDSLGRDGARFDHFYVCAVCAPTRAEFLTGRYHPRGGVRGVQTGDERLNLDETTIPETFKAAGYSTGIFGKWHNGSQPPYHPNSRGFDEFYGFTSGHWGQYFNPELDHNGTLVRGQGYITDDLTNHALDFIGKNRTQPFFCYLPYNTPHSPMEVPDRFFEKFANFNLKMLATNPRQESLPMTRAALAMCENIDWNVGRVLARLDELGLRDNTIVFYFSDNGPNSWRWNAGMKGRKGSVDEGGLRAPLVVRWPGHIRAGLRIDRIAGAIDLLPTLADMAGIPPRSRKPLDGKSLKPLLEGQSRGWPDRMIFTLQRRRVSVRTQQYRLDPDGMLFDISADPGQQRDISAEQPQVTARLKKAVEDWSNEVLPNVGPDQRPLPVGYSAVTRLPADDGVSSGGIQRSSKWPNCSFFTDWKSVDDRITWDVEVAEAGRYTAEIYYACRSQDVGAAVNLSFRGAEVSAKITEAHDPPLVGATSDRVPRDESYAKEFKPFRLGTINLSKGRGPLILRATEIPGERVADLRYVVLARIN